MLFQKRTSANVPAVRGRNLATVRPNDANDVLPYSAENGASADTNNSISVKSAKWTVFPDHITIIITFYIFIVIAGRMVYSQCHTVSKELNQYAILITVIRLYNTFL